MLTTWRSARTPASAARRRRSFALAAAVVLGVLPVVALPASAHALAVDDNPPPVGGKLYDDAVKVLGDWYGEAIVLVAPNGLPGKADHSQLRVQRTLLVNPGWSSSSGQRPVVWLYLVAPVPELVGRTLREARDLLVPPGICVSWSPRDAADGWLVTEQDPAAGTLFAVTNCYGSQANLRSPPAVTLRAADRAVVPVVDPTGSGDGGRITPAALRTAATVSGVVALLLLLALLGLLRARRRRHRARLRQPEIRVHYPDGELRVDPEPGSASRVVSIRPQFDPGSATLEEVGS